MKYPASFPASPPSHSGAYPPIFAKRLLLAPGQPWPGRDRALTIASVRLGAMGVDAGTSGTLYFDDYESRRLTRIGLLADPGLDETEPTPVAGWTNKSYSYDDDSHKHAVTSVVVTDANNNQITNTYRYDDNGNMTCRRENGRGLCTPERTLREVHHLPAGLQRRESHQRGGGVRRRL